MGEKIAMVACMVARWLLAVVAVGAVVAHTADSAVRQMDGDDGVMLGESASVGVQAYEAKLLHDDTHDLLAEADRLLGEHNELMSSLGEVPSQGAEGVADKITAIQADIQAIREKRSHLQAEATSAKANADKAPTQSEKDEHTKAHITAGAKDQDLSVEEDTKTDQLNQLQNPEEGGAGAKGSDPWSTEAFDQEWDTMRGKLHEMLTKLHSHVDQIKALAKKHYDKLQEHMAKVKQHY